MTDISLLRYLREVLKEISESSDIEQVEDEVAEALKEVEAILNNPNYTGM